jgi:hypothetical protein
LRFLAQLLGERGGEELASYRDRVLVFDKPGILPRLAAGAQTFIPVAFTREVERELGPYAKSMHSIVVYSHKPRWRVDGYGFGEPFPTWGPRIDFMREMVEMALSWKDHSSDMLCDLVECLHDLTDVDQTRVWALIEIWAKTKASDADKAVLREKIRVSTLSRRAAVRAKKKGKASGLATAGKAAYAASEPSDLLNKHIWLFRDEWVEESADEIEDIGKLDFDKRAERIRLLRIEALREILAQRGVAGILELSGRGNAAWVIGVLAASAVVSEQELQELLLLALTPRRPSRRRRSLTARDTRRQAVAVLRSTLRRTTTIRAALRRIRSLKQTRARW